MKNALAAALAVVGTMALPQAVPDQMVKLSSPDGGVEIIGRFLSYDGEFYRVDSVYGVLTVDGGGVVCEGAACPGSGPYVPELTFSGAAGLSAELVPALLEAFAARSGLAWLRQQEDADQFLYVLSDADTQAPVARVRFRLTSTAEGFADLLAEAADLALAARAPTEAERARALEAGQGDLSAPARSSVLALDALVPVVAPDNAVREIGHADLADVLAGRIRNWEALGGPDVPIVLHLPAEGSSLDMTLAERILAPADATAGPATRHADLGALSSAVAADPTALGVTAFSALRDARPLGLAGSCGARIALDRMSVKTEDYPLTAPHFVFMPGHRAPEFLRDFLAFAGSAEAQDVIRGAGFVDQALESRGLAEQGDRLARAILTTGRDVGARDLRRMVRALEEAEQLSVSFRFTDGSADLDAPSRANVGLIAAAIRRGDFEGRRLLLAGFSDGQGSGATNLDLSRRRAEAVRDAVLGLLPDGRGDVALSVEGFGEAMPMACDEDAWGRQTNRRVEVWVAPE